MSDFEKGYPTNGQAATFPRRVGGENVCVSLCVSSKRSERVANIHALANSKLAIPFTAGRESR